MGSQKGEHIRVSCDIGGYFLGHEFWIDFLHLILCFPVAEAIFNQNRFSIEDQT